MDRSKLLEILTALDFMSVDMQLYLDTHPNDKDAIDIYNESVKEADVVRSEYEKHYGPLCSYRSEYNKDKPWCEDPWPWCESFNFKL